MKGGHNKKSVRVEFVMSEAEAELVKERMAELGITNLSAYLRKMAVDGYIIHLDMGDIQEMIRLLRICSNNLNQYTRRANETGSIYAADIEDIRTRLDSLWDGMDKLIRGFARNTLITTERGNADMFYFLLICSIFILACSLFSITRTIRNINKQIKEKRKIRVSLSNRDIEELAYAINQKDTLHKKLQVQIRQEEEQLKL